MYFNVLHQISEKDIGEKPFKANTINNVINQHHICIDMTAAQLRLVSSWILQKTRA